jgi:hypothetical protein
MDKVGDLVADVQRHFSRLADRLGDDAWIEACEELEDYFGTAARVRREELDR